MSKFSKKIFPLKLSTLSKKFLTPISSSISKGPLAQLKPSLIASSISLNSFVIPGTNEEAYLIILDMTDHAYSPYLSFLFIKPFKSTLSEFMSIFLLTEYSPLSRLIASITFIAPVLFIL